MGKLIKCMTKAGEIRAFAIDGRDIVDEAVVLHGLRSPAAAALGRSLMAASMMGSMLKGGSLTLQIKGGGPIGQITCVSGEQGHVKGYVTHPDIILPHNSLDKIDVGGAVGTDGMVTVIKDMGLKEPYIGRTELVSGEIAEDITHYFAHSEQTPSVCALGVLLNGEGRVIQAGGYIIQLLPMCGEEAVQTLENNINGIAPVTTLLSQGMTIEQVLSQALNGLEPETLEEREVGFRCDCTRVRTHQALYVLSNEDVEDIEAKNEQTEIVCRFCNRKYHFTPAQVRRIRAGEDE